MGDDAPSESRAVSAEYLRWLSGLLGQLRAVSETTLFPANKPETLVVAIRSDYVPEDVTAVGLEIRRYTNGDFHVTYAERYLGERRQCRWDRHDQPHSTRDHFHPLPDASTADADDREYPADLDAVLESVVFPWIDDRVGRLWKDD